MNIWDLLAHSPEKRRPIMKSESFKYTESTRQRVEREAMERMISIYEGRKIKPEHWASYDPSYSMEQYRKILYENFSSISDQDVYGQ